MEQFTALKRKALEKYFSRMNDQQRKAVFKIKGPLLSIELEALFTKHDIFLL